MDAPPERAIRWAQQWPPAGVEPAAYYFCEGPSGSVVSTNDGLLGRSASEPGVDVYVADFSTTSGSKTRWMPGPPTYSDMTVNDRKALTFTTEPLAEPVEIIGHPIVHLWLQSSADDVDVFAYLEDVDAEGRSDYVTEGCLRGSHRAVSEAPYDNFGLPYHSSLERDIRKLDGRPVELVFDMLPTAKHFKAGHRIRIAVTCADKDSYQHLRSDPAPTIKVLRNASYRSFVTLPVAD
jgi:putative CocE/NonD family hydrolase